MAHSILGLTLTTCCLGLAGCILEQNPDFDDDTHSGGKDDHAVTMDTGSDSSDSGDGNDSSGSDSGNDCPPGTLDCDDMPGCEADASDPNTCGECSHSCNAFGLEFDCNAGTCEGTVTRTISADSYTSSDTPENNYGNNNFVIVADDPNLGMSYGILELPLADLPEQAEITDLTLHLFNDGQGIEVTVHEVMGPWTENSVTWTMSPPVGPPITSVSLVPNDNTVELSAILPVPDGYRGLSLRPAEQGSTSIHSRENSDGPTLEIGLQW